ncbi:ATP-dependent RNA helicase SUV3 [Paecilomyces variotii No. 5]|uniref:RNA helicase n=1 Tax=Byssochlamys spectabilis (strain No. 5 / NBRC 109023) TaxID=1356009 RepID=V5G827_BYSSN|nr:ATP-dependent RNA helicase SUV3 [Paecilomyces variotii No. 5]
MQLWTSSGRGSHCLFCSFRVRTAFPRAERLFTTTSVLARAGGSSTPDHSRRALRSLKAKSKSPQKNAPSHLTQSFRRVLAGEDFPSVVASILHDSKEKLHPADPALKNWGRIQRFVLNASKLENRGSSSGWSPLRQLNLSLKQAYLRRGVPGLRKELDHFIRSDAITNQYSIPNLTDQRKVTDLRYPAEWYPHARSMQRTIHLHVGPTNSGKTYHALKRLESSKHGFYAGPLRLLAQEVYHRFNANGIPCGLVTGDDVKFPSDEAPRIVSNTVEMVGLGKEFEVGVIDEIQMIADPKRGWAWTRAVLGARATELHLCGEARAVPLIRELVALTGDTLEIHRYQRLNPLKVMSKSIKGDLKQLRKGDCVVSFSRLGIHALKAEIEKVTGRRAAIVYGSLPAEIRTQQASLFNDPNNDYDYLVASDAIGMGLNLSIKRIIFETLVKRIPGGLVRLTVPEIKQIAGRAGRYRPATPSHAKGGTSEEPDVGLVTSLEEVDLPYIQQAMSIEPAPLRAAGIFPPDSVLQNFAAYFPPDVPFQYIIKRVLDLAQVHPLFFMCDPVSQLQNAELIDAVNGLRIDDQLIFMAAPIYARDPSAQAVTRAFARCVTENSGGRLLDIPELNLEILEQPVSGKKEYLHELESLHKSIILYSWLSFRFGGIFTDRTLAAHVKELAEERMVRALTEFSANKKLMKDASLRAQIALQKQMQERDRLLAEANIESANQDTLPIDLSADETRLESADQDLLPVEGPIEGLSAEESNYSPRSYETRA